MRLNVKSKRCKGIAIFIVLLGIDFVLHLVFLGDYCGTIASLSISSRDNLKRGLGLENLGLFSSSGVNYFSFLGFVLSRSVFVSISLQFFQAVYFLLCTTCFHACVCILCEIRVYIRIPGLEFSVQTSMIRGRYCKTMRWVWFELCFRQFAVSMLWLLISRFTAVGSEICFVLLSFHLYNGRHEGNGGYEGQGDEEGNEG